jgi:tetratricopeptide (TPR) repeat protein
LTVAGGNPGLQEILCRPILAGEVDAAGKALDAVEHWKASGEVPQEENAAQEFFQRVSFETYRNALTESQHTQLRATTLFSENLPIPMAALEAAGQALGAVEPRVCLNRLIGLGLVDFWGEIFGIEHAAANPLARPLAGENLTDEEENLLATAAIAPMAKAWRDADGDFPFDPRGVEAARLALTGDGSTDVLEAAAYAAGSFLFEQKHNAKAALTVILATLAKIAGQGGSPQPGLLLIASNCAERIGEIELQITLLEKGLILDSNDKVSLAQIAAAHAEATIERYGPEKTLSTLRSILTIFEKIEDRRSGAITLSKIAEILQGQGKNDEGLCLLRKKVLPVFEELGDVRERAGTMGLIADIHQKLGDTDEALRIRYEDELPVYERLGEVRKWAIAKSKVAEIIENRGEVDEALRIYTEDCMPVAVSTDDMAGIAHILFSCARIRLSRGGLEKGEALTIFKELAESFARNKKLQSAEGIGSVGWLLGQVLARVGRFDEAINVLDETADAFDSIGKVEDVAKVREMQEKILAEKA